jgi:hypothetical protein
MGKRRRACPDFLASLLSAPPLECGGEALCSDLLSDKKHVRESSWPAPNRKVGKISAYDLPLEGSHNTGPMEKIFKMCASRHHSD